MVRKLSLQDEGTIYHLTVRGNGRQQIFLGDNNRERLLWRLGESSEMLKSISILVKKNMRRGVRLNNRYRNS